MIGNELLQNTTKIVNGIYADLIKRNVIQPHVDIWHMLNHSIYYYYGAFDRIQIRIGYDELDINPDGTLWLCVDPSSPKFKHLYIYIGSAPIEYADFNAYFMPQYAQQSFGTLSNSFASEILPH
jgi:hypothetical protein